MGQNARVEGKASISSEEGGDDQGGGSTYSHVFYECFQASGGHMQSYGSHDLQVLVRLR